MSARTAAPRPKRVAIIGMGPRGLTVYERLIALAGACTATEPEAPATASGSAAPPAPLEIHVIDPCPPGPGRVWRTDQDPGLLMNTVIAEQTVFPDASCDIPPTGTGPDMGTWYTERGGTEDPTATFGSRRLYGEYLGWAYERIRASSPAHVTTHEHRARATAILEPSVADPRSEPQVVRLSDSTSIEVDAVVLCLGHVPARLGDERAAWARFAADARLTYLPPTLPAEAAVDLLPAGERVLFRGFGLNYFDLQCLLTTGRGGRFDVAGDGLVYRPSGREPILAPASRRGVPYRSKPVTADHPRSDHRLRYFTEENVRTLAAGDPLHFNDQLWPLILADLRHGWYAALARSAPEAFADSPGRLTEALAESVDRHLGSRRTDRTRESDHRPGRLTHPSPAWAEVEADVLADPTRALDLHRLLRPLEGLRFSGRAAGSGEGSDANSGEGSADSGEESRPGTLAESDGRTLHDWTLGFLRDDLAASRLGPELSPGKALFAVLWSARDLLKRLVAAGRIDETSFVTEIRGWFEDFVAGICDGPPPQRYAELIALAEAGLVEFVGAEVRITTSRAGRPAAFVAASPSVAEPVSAPALVDASSPANHVRLADDELLAGMLERGQLAVAVHRTPEGIEQSLSGLVVDGPARRTVDARGRVHPRRHCLSIQLSSIQLGLAIASNPGRSAQSLRDAHAIAEAILDRAD